MHHDIVHAAQLGIVRFERLGRCQRGAQRQDELMLVETDGQLEALNLSDIKNRVEWYRIE